MLKAKDLQTGGAMNAKTFEASMHLIVQKVKVRSSQSCGTVLSWCLHVTLTECVNLVFINTLQLKS